MTNAVLETILKRRSIKRYKAEQITDEELNLILTAGEYAPNAGGRQSPRFVVCQNEAVIHELGELNMLELIKIRQGNSAGSAANQRPGAPNANISPAAFHGAPTLVTLFAPKDWYNYTLDCAAAAENMLLAAESIGVGSCIIARAPETFATARGKEIQQAWGLGDEYEAKLFVLLGYAEGTVPVARPRDEGRIIYTK